MGWETIQEGSALVNVPLNEKISKDLPVFYNPSMKSNRDVTIMLLNAVEKDQMSMIDLMAGSGIRSIRFLKELKPGKIKDLTINDPNPNSIDAINRNLVLNQLDLSTVKITRNTADQVLSWGKAYDYIDIDPFGSPNPFLDLAAKYLKSKGILAVTATDTAPLCGTYPLACKRKYWATPLRTELMHEIAVRILIRKVQLICGQYEKAAIPLFSFTKEHYIRVFFSVITSKSKVDQVLSQHQLFKNTGPLWIGPLHDPDLIQKMASSAPKELQSSFEILKKESEINTIGFVDLHEIARAIKAKNIPKMEVIIKEICKMKHQASRTIFSLNGIRTTISEEEIKEIVKKLN